MTALWLACLDLEELVVGADDEVGREGRAVGAGGQVGDISLDPGQRLRLGLQLPVDAVGAITELDEPVALDGGPARDSVLGFGDLLVDPAQGAAGAVVAVLVVDHLVAPAAVRTGWPGLGEHVPVRDGLAGVLTVPPGDHVRDLGDAHA
jgi:hypothetical protein